MKTKIFNLSNFLEHILKKSGWVDEPDPDGEFGVIFPLNHAYTELKGYKSSIMFSDVLTIVPFSIKPITEQKDISLEGFVQLDNGLYVPKKFSQKYLLGGSKPKKYISCDIEDSIFYKNKLSEIAKTRY